MVLEAKKRKEEQVQNTQTLKSGRLQKENLVVSEIWIFYVANWIKKLMKKGPYFICVICH